MADNSGRVVWLWGPLLLLAVLVAVFRFAETGSVGPEDGEARRAAPSSAHADGPTEGTVATARSPGGEMRLPGGGFAPYRGYEAAPYAAGHVPYHGIPGVPPWAWPYSYPRPGDYSGRYWGGGAAEWGPPVGEYGPDTEVDPYWWVAAEEADR